jgi:hypothetical protein
MGYQSPEHSPAAPRRLRHRRRPDFRPERLKDAARVDSFPGADLGSEDVAVDGIDAEAEVFERSM